MTRAVCLLVLGALISGCATGNRDAAPVRPADAAAAPESRRAPSKHAKVSFELIVSKQEFHPGDPVNVKFQLTNRGSTGVYVNKRFHINDASRPANSREVTLDVTDASHQRLPCVQTHEAALPRTELFEWLEPGTSVSSEGEHDLRHLFSLSKPGVYTLVGTYQNAYGKEIGVDALTKPVTSSPVTVILLEQ